MTTLYSQTDDGIKITLSFKTHLDEGQEANLHLMLGRFHKNVHDFLKNPDEMGQWIIEMEKLLDNAETIES